MGIGVDNANFHLHAQATGTINGNPNYHRGDQSIDDTGPDVGTAGFCDLVRAASSQSAFDTQAATTYGNWYSGKPSDFKTGQYRIFNAIKSDLGL